jgi:hypothetical protein
MTASSFALVLITYTKDNFCTDKMDLEQASASIDALIEKRSREKEDANKEEELSFA